MTNYHIEHIKAYLKSQGLTDQELMDDLTDHLATEIEFSMDSEKLGFETSFEIAKQKLLPNSPYQLERDLKILTTPKHNIMIKKIAYVGGYLSTIGICLSVLFLFLSFQNEVKIDSRSELIGTAQLMQFLEQDAANPKEMTEIRKDFFKETTEIKLTALQQLSWSQSLLIISCSILLLTYLPYQFYHRYQKSQLELTA
ncbi:hypothetical protein [Roseivirga sp.]|uniref:hypothetical protein n=1 Tax=Roseivirga sp. TaxID=1964215 RepID=UPI003B51BBB3